MSNQLKGVSIAPSIRFALRESSGRWLHFSLERVDGKLRTVEDEACRWLGTIDQLQNVYAQHPETINLQAVKITPAMLASAR